MRAQTKNVLSLLLLAGGACLAYVGVREYLDSRAGQYQAAREFERPPAPAISPRGVRRGETLAKLKIPRLDAELYIIEGDGPRELRRGPGHLEGTALPGEKGNCVIAGHRDTHFRVLKDIREGDDIVLQTDSGQYLYRVRKTHIVSPEDTSALHPTKTAALNLITCYPFYYVGSAPKRFVVEAQLAGAVERPS